MQRMNGKTRRSVRLLAGWLLPAVLALMVAGCGENGDRGSATSAARNGEAVKKLVSDLSAGKIKAKSASVSATELTVEWPDGERTVHALPQDEFFVSIAPYIDRTHPCVNHSLTGCRGELAGMPFDIRIEDESGAVLLETTAVTPDNGFIDLWLPRNRTFRVTISRDGRTAVSDISTFDGEPTCITTMRLL